MLMLDKPSEIELPLLRSSPLVLGLRRLGAPPAFEPGSPLERERLLSLSPAVDDFFLGIPSAPLPDGFGMGIAPLAPYPGGAPLESLSVDDMLS